MNTKHTPGPWLADLHAGTVYAHLAKFSPVVARTDGTSNMRANTRLIAAAPDLLAALHDLLSEAEAWGVKMEAFTKARAALAKVQS
jgi:hypothetical protein